MKRVGISVTPLSSSTFSVPPVTSPVLASMSQVSSLPASAQISPVSSSMMSRAANLADDVVDRHQQLGDVAGSCQLP